MAETTEFVSTIRVKDLISAFESKSDLVRVEFSRPRAKSVGNILAKNVVVRQNEFNSLDDIEKALKKLETGLNFYQVYQKDKHVDFQEQLFNILTSIVNIEDTGEDASLRKKALISKTQTLVSFLNQKLPSNAGQLAKTPQVNPYRYTPYAARPQENGIEDGSKPNKQTFAIYSENTRSIDITDSGDDVFVSVKKLKETFQPKEESKPEEQPKLTKQAKETKQTPVANGKIEEPQQTEKVEESPENVSVSRLRNLFERRSEETSKGIGIITDEEKPQKNPFIYSSTSNIPYTERNLGNVRLQRSVSGNYMNYVGLLKRVDISKSTGDLNKDFTNSTPVVNKVEDDSLSEASDSESDDSVNTVEERKSVHEIMKLYSHPNKDNTDFKRTNSNSNAYDREKVYILNEPEEIKVKYSTTITVNETKQPQSTIVKNEEDVKPPHVQEIAVKYSTPTFDNFKEPYETQEALATIGSTEEEVNYSTASSTLLPNKQDVATFNRSADEEDVTYSTAQPHSLSKNNEEQESATVRSTEEEVRYSSAVTDESVLNGSVEEEEESSSTLTPGDTENSSEAELKGIEEETVKYSTSQIENLSNSSSTTNEAEFKGIAEEYVVYSTGKVENLPQASADSTNSARIEPSANTTDTTDGIAKSSVIGSEEALAQSIIDEELQKIDVEQTLANEEIDIDEEDLKNADNDFEMLLESSTA